MNTDATKTYLLQDFIDQGKLSSVISYDKLLFKTKNDNGEIIPVYNLINDYYDELYAMSIIGVMSDIDFAKYQFRPKLLSYDLYGSTELFFLLLLLNNISSVKQFNFKKVRLIDPTKINTILSYIYSNEKQNIINNRAKIGETII